MRGLLIFGSLTILGLAGCSDTGQFAEEQAITIDAQEPPTAEISYSAEAADTAESQSNPSITTEVGDAIAAPQIAYRYALGFRLPASAIKQLQNKHADMCESREPNACRIISMRQADQDGDYAYGNLQIAVAADQARAFTKELESSSDNSDAELVSSSIDGEDLSKAIVDTEARLRARTLLRDRLMEVLRTRKGTVAELVEAERGVAQVNQEIDQARSWLNEMRGRVAFSQMTISYESGAPSAGGFTEPIRNAWNSLGSILGTMVAFLMLAITVLVPIGLLVAAGLHLWRRIRPRQDAKPVEGLSEAEAAKATEQ